MSKFLSEIWQEIKDALAPLFVKRTRGAWIVFGIVALCFLSDKIDTINSLLGKLSRMGTAFKFIVEAIQSPPLQFTVIVGALIWIGVAAIIAGWKKDQTATVGLSGQLDAKLIKKEENSARPDWAGLSGRLDEQITKGESDLERLKQRVQHRIQELSVITGFRIEALPPVPDTVNNVTQHVWHEGAKITFDGYAVVGVENLLPGQGIDLVNFRILSITPPLKAKKAWMPSTQDFILRRVEFVDDLPRNATINPGITTDVRLFKVTRPFSAARIEDIEIEFYGRWPEKHGTSFTPSERHLVVLEVSGNGVARAEATLEMTFSTDQAKPAFTWTKLSPPAVSVDDATERTFIGSETLRDLLSSFEGRTPLQNVKLIEVHRDSWAHINGEVKNVSAISDNAVVLIQHSDGSKVGCMFSKTWRDKLEDFKPGDAISVIGKIAPQQNGQQLFFVDCELPS